MMYRVSINNKTLGTGLNNLLCMSGIENLVINDLQQK